LPESSGQDQQQRSTDDAAPEADRNRADIPLPRSLDEDRGKADRGCAGGQRGQGPAFEQGRQIDFLGMLSLRSANGKDGPGR